MTTEEKLRAIIARGRRQATGAVGKMAELGAGPGPEPAGTISVMGTPAKVYRTRPECMAAGYCKWLTLDCDWYAIIDDQGNLTGRCRERVKGAAGEERSAWALEELDKRRSALH